MGTFSQLGGVVAKAATVESPIVVKNADGTYMIIANGAKYKKTASGTEIKNAN